MFVSSSSYTEIKTGHTGQAAELTNIHRLDYDWVQSKEETDQLANDAAPAH